MPTHKVADALSWLERKNVDSGRLAGHYDGEEGKPHGNSWPVKTMCQAYIDAYNDAYERAKAEKEKE